VKWVPAMHYSPRGSRTLLTEDFESAKFGSSDIRNPRISADKFAVERTTSFGEGVQCARATGGGELTADLGGSAHQSINVDLDLFIRSSKDFPYILPDPTTRSHHSVVISVEGGQSKHPLAAIDSSGGTWRLWDGQQFGDSGKVVTYDVWNHLQLAIDTKTKQYRFIVQPVGEMPTVVGESTCDSGVNNDESLRLNIKPSATAGHISCYDNIEVTCN